MVLPLYSVMKTISPSLMRAGKSLGGTPLVSFVKIYFPLTIPGIGAGCLLVFILAIGYYITPALVGGASGSLISNTYCLSHEEFIRLGFCISSWNNAISRSVSYLLGL